MNPPNNTRHSANIQAALKHIEAQEQARKQAARLKRKNIKTITIFFGSAALIYGFLFWLKNAPPPEPEPINPADVTRASRFLATDDSGLVLTAEARGDILWVKVDNTWFLLHPGMQIQHAQIMQRRWDRIVATADGRASIYIEDRMGNDLAQSEWLNPRKIKLTR